MKRFAPAIFAGLALAGVGFLIRPYSGHMGICLVLDGLILFCGVIAYAALRMTEIRCPNCKNRIPIETDRTVSGRNRMVCCGQCGAMVRPDRLAGK